MQLPGVPIVYGGVYPTYHGKEILAAEPCIDVIVRGEGEATAVHLADAMETAAPLGRVNGIDYREGGSVRSTAPAAMIADLDARRVGWELIEDWDLYQCWGAGRSAVVQFSRGCPHQCTYCGQRGFWTKWRYRDVEKTAAEIGWLHREKGVNFIDLADENPTSSKRIWQRFLEAVVAEKVPVKLFATIRAPDIVRDADILHLYKRAGIECVLMGMETTDPETIAKIRKGLDDARRSRSDPAVTPARHPVHGRPYCRLRAGDSTRLLAVASSSSSSTTPTCSTRCMSPLIAGPASTATTSSARLSSPTSRAGTIVTRSSGRGICVPGKSPCWSS